MNPYQQLCKGAHHFKAEINEEMDELIAFAEIMSRQKNMVTLDQNGTFYAIASGDIDEVINVLEQQITKLKRIREERNIDRKPI